MNGSLRHERGNDGRCLADGLWMGPLPDAPWWLGLDQNGDSLTGSAYANWALLTRYSDGDWANHMCPTVRNRPSKEGAA